MDEKSLMLGLLTKTLNKTDEEVSELLYKKADDGSLELKDEALDVSIDLLEKKVTKLKDAFKLDEKKLRDEGYKRAQKEVMGSFENELKEKHSLESDKTGSDLIEDLLEKYKGSGSELEPDKIKLSQTYRDRERELTKQLKDLRKDHETALETLKGEHGKEKVWRVAESYIRKKLAEVNPALPKNPKAAENLRNLFINSFTEFDYQVNGDEMPLPLKEGKRVEDKLGNEVPFDTLINERINDFFDIPVQGPKGGPGNEQKEIVTDGVPASFKDNDEYNKYQLSHSKEPAKRIIAKKVWEAQQK